MAHYAFLILFCVTLCYCKPIIEFFRSKKKTSAVDNSSNAAWLAEMNEKSANSKNENANNEEIAVTQETEK